ncbi:hypothetical protein [Epilithonimonas sp.]|uniref:hypothetical protein n=1 Tax=Epilithonimonas sp. TaxID=2894511 RepID=UPI002FDC8123
MVLKQDFWSCFFCIFEVMNNKFNEIIKSENFSLVSDLSEISLDKFITNDTLKDIPILGSITKILSIGNTINDRIFTNKLIHFLNELKDLDKDFILKEIQFIDDSKEYQHKVGEKLLEIISRVDSDEKPKIIGRLFNNFLLKRISYSEFLKLTYIVEKTFLPNLFVLKSLDDKMMLNISFEEEEILINGLCKKRANPFYMYTQNELEDFRKKNSKITELGSKLLHYGLK